jgi:transposase
MRVKNLVRLKVKEEDLLKTIVRKGSEKARKITRCRLLLMANDGKSDTQIIEMLGIARNTVRTARYRYSEEGLEAAINEQPRSGAPERIDGKQKAKITAIACSAPPEGRNRWTLRLIADKVVELDIADSISHQTVKRILKKTNLNRI